MLLAIDVGNTNLVVGVFEGDRLVESWRLATDNRRSADEYGTMIESMMLREGIRPEHIDDIIADLGLINEVNADLPLHPHRFAYGVFAVYLNQL